MKKYLVATTSVACICLAVFTGVRAAGPDRSAPVEVTVRLGTATGDLVISPRDSRFEKGRYCKLSIENPSDVTHRLSVASFASLVRSYGKRAIDRGQFKGRAVFKSRVP